MLQWFWSLLRCFQTLAGEYLQIYHGFMSVISHFHCWLDVCLCFGIRIRSVWCVKQEHLLFPWGFRNGYVSRCSPLGRTSGSLPLPYAFGTIYKIIIVEYRVGIAILRCNFPARGVVHFRIPSIPWWLYRYQIMYLYLYIHILYLHIVVGIVLRPPVKPAALKWQIEHRSTIFCLCFFRTDGLD